MRRFPLVCVALMIALSAADALASRYYVSTTGSNTFPYDTVPKAARRIQAAIDAVSQVGQALDTVEIQPGTYYFYP
jgi:polygalacturonase